LLRLLVADVTSGRLLDVGCGPAYLAPGLLARGIGYAGVDRNAAMLARARRRITPSAGKILVVRSDATALPFRTGSFDLVIAAGVLGLLDLHSRQAALREMARVTRGEIRLLEPFRRPGAPPHTLRAHVIGLVPDRPLDLTELAEAGLIPEVHGPPLLAGVYSRIHAFPRSGGFGR
jgi:ubiquinone/menaquinone biosynthesis C-methylase UbiE